MQIIINGGGKIGEYLASHLTSGGHQVAIIEIDRRKLQRLADKLPQRVLLILGDGCDPASLVDAGAAHADIFVATTGADDVNLVSCELAAVAHNISRTIARVNNPKNERIFRRLGIETVSSTTVIARLIEMETTQGAVHAVMSLSQGDLEITEVPIPRALVGAAEQGKRVADIAGALPRDSLLVAVGEGSSLEIVNGDTVLHPGDVLLTVSKAGLADQIRDALTDLW
ncbi:MAG: TrkA family potassium uptake protein [Coriobacteriales bacterium]|jgi:trk system potassium uptake protein TrkA|nr:TrkA family potassium uptake protein [Coriobacteriales bacterium]